MTGSSTGHSDQFDRYLLGELSAAEAAALEERYFVDDEEFARLEVATDDLADRYVVGRLTADERGRFERHCLGSRDDRLRLRVAAALRRHRVPAVAAKRVTLFQSLVAVFAAQGAGIRFAAAAAGVVMVLAVSVLTIRTTQLQSELNRLRTNLSEGLADERESAGLAIERERTQREDLEQRLRGLTTSRFVLLPGTTRGAGVDLVVANDASYVRFDLALERPSTSGRCRVTLRTIDRATLWSQDLTAASPEPSSQVSVTIPASVVGAGQVEIVLQEVASLGATSDVATYGFRVLRGR